MRLSVRVPADSAPWPEARLAAVAAVLRVVDEPELLFIKRAEVAHDPWSGHVAFPGGRMEPDDESLEATAIRETFEELSLDLKAGQMLGRLDDLLEHAVHPEADDQLALHRLDVDIAGPLLGGAEQQRVHQPDDRRTKHRRMGLGPPSFTARMIGGPRPTL